MSKIQNDYLTTRSNTFTISATTGKWNRKKHEELFKSGVDGDFENWNAIPKKDKATPNIKARPYDLTRDGTYMQIIPDKPQSFFVNATQALQVIHDNLALQEEILKKDRRVHLPFINEKGEKFVAYVFKDDGALLVVVNEFSNDGVWDASDGYVFVFPQQSSENSELESTEPLKLKIFDPYLDIVEWLYLNSGNQLSNEFKKQLLEKLKEVMK